MAVVSAMLSSQGMDRMLADAARAVALVPEWSPFRAFALVVLGAARILTGDVDEGRTGLLAAADLGDSLGAHPARVVALAELASLAIERGEWSVAEAHASKARSIVVGAGLDDYPVTALAYAVAARTMVHRGDLVKARSDLAHLGRIVPALTYAIPWLAIQARLEMARAHLGLGEGDAARGLLAEIDTILERRPDVGRLQERVDALRAQLDESASDRRVESLTEAELRLVPLLPTHLSFIEIAELHVLSPNTVKTQAISIYRKLGASSRSDAVARARKLGLLEG
jgi:LuxR family maltose regulon positive regulatory protein